MDMTPKLTPEQSQALHDAGNELPILDPKTNKFYVVIEQSVHEQGKAALDRQRSDIEAIQEGLDDLNAGRVMELDEAHQGLKEKFAQQYGPEV